MVFFIENTILFFPRLFFAVPAHKVKISAPPAPAGASRCAASLHAQSVRLSCHQAHFVEKPPLPFGKRWFFWHPLQESNL